jgi:hypothetical protein
LVILVCIFLSSLLLAFLKEDLGIHYLLSSMISVLTVMFLKFFIFREFVFK